MGGEPNQCVEVLSLPPQADGMGSPDNFKKYPFLVISPLTCCQKEELQACTCLYSHPARHSGKQPPPPPMWGRALFDTDWAPLWGRALLDIS